VRQGSQMRRITFVGLAALALSACGSSSGSAPGAPKAVNTKVATDVAEVSAAVTDTLAALGEATKQATQDNINALASLAQQAHDTLSNVRDQMALDNVPTDVEVATNDLKNAMGALVAYTGNPNPATLAHFTSQWTTAEGEWNDAVIALYRNHTGTPPTIGTG
jgi:ABC-type transporter Mla subunit MlaD